MPSSKRKSKNRVEYTPDPFIELQLETLKDRQDEHKEYFEKRIEKLEEEFEKALDKKVDVESFKPTRSITYWFVGTVGYIITAIIVYLATKGA